MGQLKFLLREVRDVADVAAEIVGVGHRLFPSPLFALFDLASDPGEWSNRLGQGYEPPEIQSAFDTFRASFHPMPDAELWQDAMGRVAGWLPAWFETRRSLSESESFNILVATVL